MDEVRVRLESREEIVLIWTRIQFNQMVQSQCMPFTHIKAEAFLYLEQDRA